MPSSTPEIYHKCYLDMRYVMNYYNIWHKKPKKIFRPRVNACTMYLEHYGELRLPTKLNFNLVNWYCQYSLTLIRAGICPLRGDTNKAVPLQGPCLRPDHEHLDRLLNWGKRVYNYGTNTNSY